MSLAEPSYYELLEVPRDATGEEIARAYQMALGTYETDSLATYSLYGEEELRAIRRRIEEAHRVLSDAEERAVYDGRFGDVPDVGVEIDLLPPPEERRPEVAREITGLDPLEVEGELPLNGAGLRRARLERGISIERICEVTKVSFGHLENIELDDYAALPAAVYVRGFVAAYARCIGVDADRAANEYMATYRAADGQASRQKR
jgi:curved DNA-binding protein CbpA